MLKKILPVLDWIKRHKYLSVTVVFLLIIVVIDDNNMFKHIRNQAVISELEDEIATMKRDSAEIVKRQNRLDYRGDVDAIEELAREKYDMHKDNENLRKNGRMRAKYDKWLVLIPFLCYPAIFLISAEIAVYGGYQRKNCYLSVAFL